jgi:hypothetical protein
MLVNYRVASQLVTSSVVLSSIESVGNLSFPDQLDSMIHRLPGLQTVYLQSCVQFSLTYSQSASHCTGVQAHCNAPGPMFQSLYWCAGILQCFRAHVEEWTSCSVCFITQFTSLLSALKWQNVFRLSQSSSLIVSSHTTETCRSRSIPPPSFQKYAIHLLPPEATLFNREPILKHVCPVIWRQVLSCNCDVTVGSFNRKRGTQFALQNCSFPYVVTALPAFYLLLLEHI